MKLKYTYLIGLLAAAALTSCVSENTDSEPALSGDTGKMALKVSTLEPTVTRALTQVFDFPVIVKDAENAVVNSYDHVSNVPSTVILGVGNYTVESHTPGDIQKRMTAPYYYGIKDMVIEKDITTNVDVVCKMLNSSIQMKYDADFLSLFSTWTVTINDGSETALDFTKNDGEEIVYWYFEDDTETLTLNFTGTTNAGNNVTATRLLSKNDAAVAQYDDDVSSFSGGDKIEINFTPVESTEGTVTSITINANVTFSESEATIPVDVTDAGFTDDPNPGSGDNPTPGDNPQTGDPITLTLPGNMVVSGSTDPSLGDTFIKCDNGIKSIKVSIASTSEEMMSSLSDLNANYGVDFVNGAEIVENSDVVQLFNDLGQTLTVPNEGDTEYTFPIGNFFVLLSFLPGDHTFNLVIEDKNGSKKNGVLILTVQ